MTKLPGTNKYIITWSMVYEANDLLDAVKMAVGELQDPQIDATILSIETDDAMLIVEARSVFHDEPEQGIVILSRRDL